MFLRLMFNKCAFTALLPHSIVCCLVLVICVRRLVTLGGGGRRLLSACSTELSDCWDRCMARMVHCRQLQQGRMMSSLEP
jgi:hypothetical protein